MLDCRIYWDMCVIIIDHIFLCSFRSMTDTLRDRPRARLNVNSRHFRDIAFS